ncbi:hypothetical protein AYI68_g982 [Smittium mucronatum]|uniref:Uncharacterized protein n=1 Tax=Smittium mucronatum TaxID=133383 RepID=A0A1R0H6U6_9FUNG|nr:hypothetical protein AYI68_g982 [Smittium mucronatum]
MNYKFIISLTNLLFLCFLNRVFSAVIPLENLELANLILKDSPVVQYIELLGESDQDIFKDLVGSDSSTTSQTNGLDGQVSPVVTPAPPINVVGGAVSDTGEVGSPVLSVQPNTNSFNNINNINNQIPSTPTTPQVLAPTAIQSPTPQVSSTIDKDTKKEYIESVNEKSRERKNAFKESILSSNRYPIYDPTDKNNFYTKSLIQKGRFDICFEGYCSGVKNCVTSCIERNNTSNCVENMYVYAVVCNKVPACRKNCGLLEFRGFFDSNKPSPNNVNGTSSSPTPIQYPSGGIGPKRDSMSDQSKKSSYYRRKARRERKKSERKARNRARRNRIKKRKSLNYNDMYDNLESDRPFRLRKKKILKSIVPDESSSNLPPSKSRLFLDDTPKESSKASRDSAKQISNILRGLDKKNGFSKKINISPIGRVRINIEILGNDKSPSKISDNP